MIEIDGSRGEGGGQILRSALALSILTKQPFRLINIRAGRPKPGLAAQHLTCVRAAATICGGFYKGGAIGSTSLFFEPGEVKSGNYVFSIGTAGATSLVLHTVALPLALRGKEPSEVVIAGGTHVSHSPCFHFLETTWCEYLRRFGVSIELQMIRPGFYPRGGGEIRAKINPCARVKPLNLMKCPELTTAGGFSAVADLPESIAKRQARRMAERLKRIGVETHFELETWSGGPSSVAAILFRQASVPPFFFALGERGKPSEAVADEAADQAIAFHAAKCPVDPHSADQIILPLAFAPEASEFRVSESTRHLHTNIGVIREFTNRDISCDADEGSSGTVRIDISTIC